MSPQHPIHFSSIPILHKWFIPCKGMYTIVISLITIMILILITQTQGRWNLTHPLVGKCLFQHGQQSKREIQCFVAQCFDEVCKREEKI